MSHAGQLSQCIVHLSVSSSTFNSYNNSNEPDNGWNPQTHRITTSSQTSASSRPAPLGSPLLARACPHPLIPRPCTCEGRRNAGMSTAHRRRQAARTHPSSLRALASFTVISWPISFTTCTSIRDSQSRTNSGAGRPNTKGTWRVKGGGVLMVHTNEASHHSCSSKNASIMHSQ